MAKRPPSFSMTAAPQRKSWARPSKAAGRRLRGRKGQSLRRAVLDEEPLCRVCRRLGLVSAATEVDHITPLSEGGSNERRNLQPLCGDHHREKTEAEASARRQAAPHLR